MKTKQITILFSILLVLLPVSVLHSQTSAFSVYGIGELYSNGFGRNYAMGGTGIGVRSPQHLNSLNPASYTVMDTLSFFFEAGVRGKLQVFSLNSESNQHSSIDIDNFAFGFPLARFLFTSIGVRPAATTKYSFANSDDKSWYSYKGDGNIANFYGGLGLKITKSLSVGVHVCYLFGDNKNFYSQMFSYDDRVFGGVAETRINDVILDFGAQYIYNIKDNKLIIGATFSPKSKINGKSTYVRGSGNSFNNDGTLVILDTIPHNWNGKNFEMPLKFGLGLSYMIDKRLTLAFDYSTTKWSDIDFSKFNPNTSASAAESSDSYYFATGLEWIPNLTTGIKYYERIRYRAGLFYSRDYVKFKNKYVMDYGITAGFGFPLRRTSTSINISFELGKKGIDDITVTSETYGIATVSFTMHEYWFMKSKIR